MKPYVFCYWESQFPDLRLKQADSRQRVYRHENIETLGAIKKLLYEERLTIQGAKARLKAMKRGDQPAIVQGNLLNEIKEELQEILEILR